MHSRDKAPDDLVELGRIVSAYGVKGWIKVQPFSMPADVLLGAKSWWLLPPASPLGKANDPPSAMKVTVVASRPHGGTVVAQLKDYSVREEVELFKAYTVAVPRAEFPPAEEDEFYWVDLIGCRVFGQLDGKPSLIGEVLDVTDNGAHAVLRVGRGRLDLQGELVFERNKNGRIVDVLVPFVETHIQQVDLKARRIESDWPVDF